MTGRIGTPRDSDLVKVAYAQDEAEAELIQGLLGTVEVSSVVRRAPGVDVPEFLAAGPRGVLVAAEDIGVARDVLHHEDHRRCARRRCASAAAPAASSTDWKRAMNPSPVVLSTTPP